MTTAHVGKRVRIVGGHPHRGCTGEIVDYKGSLGMYEVNLAECEHGTEGCFVDGSELRFVTEKLTKVPND